MQVRELFRVSFQNLLIQKRRSFLTMLGLVIGIVAVVLVTSIGAGAQSIITSQIQTRGTDMIAILAGASDDDGPPAAALGIVITTFTFDDTEALLEKSNVRHLQSIAPFISGNDILTWRNVEKFVTFTGTSHQYPVIEQTKMKEGRFFDEAEFRSGDHVVVLGSNIAEEIFANQSPVGEYIKVKKRRFRVIGVLESQGSTGFENPDDQVLMPLFAVQRDLLGVRHISFARARVTDEKYLKVAVEEVKQTLIERHGEEDFSVRNTADLLDILTNVTNAMKFFLIAVASVSLFVGGVGIMNIMLIAVREKTREIGLRKSVGARRSDILTQFLFETVIISVVGGILGILVGVLLAFIAAMIVQSMGYGYQFIVSPLSIVISCGLSIAIGLIFGVIPAKKAAALDPIDALRYE